METDLISCNNNQRPFVRLDEDTLNKADMIRVSGFDLFHSLRIRRLLF